MQSASRSVVALVAEYLHRVAECQQQNPHLMYRGHANHTWSAIPSAARPGMKGINNYPTLQTFKKFVRPYVPVPPQTELEWLVLAQHQGVATGLLDWTLNPLVALYFACDASDQDGAVLAVHFQSTYRIDHTHYVNPFVADSEFEGFALLSGKGLNARATAQNSVMTLHRGCEQNPERPTFYLEAVRELFRVPAHAKAEYRRGLMACGIGADVLFADLQASVASFKELLALASTDMIVSVP